MESKTDSLTPAPDRALLRGLGRWSFLILLAVVMIVSFVSRFVRLPTTASGNAYRGITDVEEGRYELGIEALTRAIEIDPNQLEALKTRGYARNILGDHKGALEDYERAVAVKPHDAGALQGRGRSKEALGDLDGAIADFDRALHYDPKRAESYLGRGSARAKLGDADGAQNDYTRALQIDPESGKGYLMRASLHFDEERWDEAIFGLEKGIDEIEDGPARDGAEMLLWAARSRKGDTDAANEGLRTYLRTREAAPSESTGRPTRVGANDLVVDHGRWLKALAGFVTGEGGDEDEAAVLEAAAARAGSAASERTCEALFYAGEKRVMRGDESGALERFRRGAETCGSRFYAGARAAAAVRSLLTGMGAMALERAPAEKRPAGSGASGLLVTRVHDGGPASRAGLAAGDAIVTIEGRPALPEALSRIDATGRPGDRVRLEIVEAAEEVEPAAGTERLLDSGSGAGEGGGGSPVPGGSGGEGGSPTRGGASSGAAATTPAPRKSIILALGSHAG